MNKKPSLYEVLGVSPDAQVAEIRGAFTQQLASLEVAAATLDPEQVASRKQLLRIAAGTLLDSSTRLAYDEKLRESMQLQSSNREAASQPAQSGYELGLDPITHRSAASTKVQADALALRADSLSLRADALLLQAGQRSLARANSVEREESDNAFVRILSSGPALRIMMFLIVLFGVLFGIARCASGITANVGQPNTQAAEKAALQEYFQTHGVRPANMAELELLETERRRKENEQRSMVQDADKAKREERQFEEEARRRGREVSEQLRRDEERQQQNMLMEQREKEREIRERKESERRAEAERIRLLEEKWRRTLER